MLTVELDPDNPEGVDIAKGADGVLVMKFDLTAGSNDVSVTEFNFERLGFGGDAAEKLAVYVDGKRVTKAKSANNDDEFNVTVSPSLVIPAGTTSVVEVRVDTSTTRVGEFYIKLKDIKASTTVEGLPIESNTFEVKSKDATQLEIKEGNVSTQVTLWEVQADLTEFNLKNIGNVNNSDVIVHSITLKEIGTVDHEEDIINYGLYYKGQRIADGVVSSKYITFKLNEPIVIKDDKTETFRVKWDIVGWAGKTIDFELDTDGDIIASATKYFGVNVIDKYNPDKLTIEAGEVTLYAIDAEQDKVRDDTDNVKLGTLKVVNVAGKDLNLKNLGVVINVDNTSNTGLILENVEAVINGTSYDLCDEVSGTGDTVCSDTNIDVLLPQGTTMIDFVADTADDLSDGTTIKLSLDATSGSLLYIEEMEDDTQVTDIAPSSLTWDDIEIKQPKATLSKVPLADVTVVKWTENIIALQYEVEANEVSPLYIDKVKVDIKVYSGSSDITSSVDLKDYISEIVLYKDSISDSNKLDSVAGTRLDSTTTFDGFEVEVPADNTQTFVVAVSIVDADTVINKTIKVGYNSMEIDDDQNDPVTTGGTVGFGRAINVKDSGTIVVNLTGSVDNVENEIDKVILAGTEQDVFSLDVKSLNEDVEVEKFKLYFTGAGDLTGAENLRDTIKEVKVTLNGKTVIASVSDITPYTWYIEVLFDNLTDFVVPTAGDKLVVTVSTNNIGYEQIGKPVSGIKVSGLYINKNDTKGLESNEKLETDINVDTTSIAKEFDVVPMIVTPSIVDTFGTDDINATIKLAIDAGNNTDKDDGSQLVANLSGIKLDITSLTSTGTYTVFNGNGDVIATGDITTAGTLTINISTPDPISQGENYRIEVTAEASYRLAKDGIIYEVDGNVYNIKLQDTLDMGQYARSN